MKNIKNKAQFAGALYLIIAVSAGFAFFGGYENLIVEGNATATANKIMSSESIFRIGVIGDSLAFLCEIALIVLLYQLFKPISRTLSLIASFSRLAMTIMIGMNLLNKLIVLQLLNNDVYLAAFEPNQLNGLVMLFLQAYGFGSLIWGIFFALHLLVTGYLLFKSDYFPKFLGVLLILASFGYFIDSFGNFISPQYEEIYTWIVMTTVPSELLFAFWLLIKGVNVELWEKHSLESSKGVI